jgi:hypothetical protein
VHRYHKGQLRLNMSCDALGIDDQATRYIVLESEKGDISRVHSSISTIDLTRPMHIASARSIISGRSIPGLIVRLYALDAENCTDTTITYCEQRYHPEYAHTGN